MTVYHERRGHLDGGGARGHRHGLENGSSGGRIVPAEEGGIFCVAAAAAARAAMPLI